jgi:iron complex outermembrane recepter protein
MRYLITIVTLFVLFSSLHAQTITGRVVDTESNRPVYGANVFLINTGSGDVTRRDGSFSIDVSSLPDTLRVSHVGYRTYWKVIVDSGPDTQMDVLLTPQPVQFEEIVITTLRPQQQVRHISTSVDVLDSEVMRGTRTHYMDDALQFIPGVHVQSRHNQDEARISIRGSGIRTNWGVRGINVLINGIPLTDPDGLTDIDAVDLGIVDRIEVLRGPASSLYGSGAIGGAVNFIFGERYQPFGMHVSSTAGTYNFHRHGLSLYGTHDLFSYFLSASFHSKEGYRDRSGGHSQRVFGRFKFSPNDRSDVELIAFWRTINFDLPGSLTQEEFDADPRAPSQGSIDGQWRKEKTRSRLGLRYRRGLTRDIAVSIAGFYGEHATPYHPIFMILEEDFRTSGIDTRIEIDRTIANRPNRINLGIERQYITGGARYYVNQQGERGDLGRNEQIGVGKTGVYVQDEFFIHPRLSLTIGGRYDHLSYDFTDLIPATSASFTDSFGRFTPSIGFAYEPANGIIVHANYSEGFEPPAITELRGADFRLEPIWSRHIESGIRASLGRHTETAVSAYRMNIADDIIPYTIGFQTRYRNAERTRHNGFEASVRSNIIRNVYTNFAYTYSDFRFIADENHDGNRVPGIPEHRLAAGIRYEIPGGLFLGSTVMRVGSYYLNDANSDRHESYTLVSAYAGYNRRAVTIRFSVENLFDERYASYVRTNEAQRRYFEPGDGRGVFLGIEVRY